MHFNWDTVIGQQRVKQMLRSAIRNERLAHAYLFWGNAGVGKDALAIEFARTLLCHQNGETACGECPSCKKMVLLQHPNLKFVFPLPGGDGEKNDEGESLENEVLAEVRRQIAEKSANPYFHIDIPKARFIRIKSIREIKKQSSMSGAEAGKKIFIIFDADAMNDESTNALLKVLEEPLEGVHFLLVTSRKDSVKQTILSRCQLIQCSQLSEDEIAAALRERLGASEEQSHFASRLAGGNYSRALELLGEDVDQYRRDAVRFLRSILGPSPIKLLEEEEEYFTGNKRDHAEQLLTMLLAWFRDSVVLREGAEQTLLNVDQAAELHSFVGKFGGKNLEECLNAIERALELLRRNVYLPLVMLSLTVQLRRLLHAK
ncbi:MAG: DNA polymerase III subunit [Bacteroidota bacterium]